MAGVKSSLYYRRGAGGKVAIEDQSVSTGDRYWVHSGTGTDSSSYGFSPDKPFATLDYAVGKCTASKGDTIYLMAGHAEALIAATSAAVDVAGVRIIGIGTGSLVPTFTLGTATTACIAVSAANVLIKNIKIISDLADVAAGITASATSDGLVLEDCWLTDGAAAKELVIGLECAAACDRVIVKNNYFHTVAGGGCASAVKFAGATADSVITGNYMSGDYSVACIDAVGATGTNILITDNVLDNLDAAAGLVITLDASTTGAVVRNLAHGGKDGTDPFSCAGVVVAENYGSNAEGASGLIKPAVDS